MYRILLVEDDKEAAGYVKQAFKFENIDVDIAYDGEEGLKKYRKVGRGYDLIILDLAASEMSGADFLVKMKSINPFIDVIVYTDCESFGYIKKLVNLGIDGYVNKGTDADVRELVAMVKDKLEPMGADSMRALLEHTGMMGNV